ncbi:MerR family DNA-binding protein [Agrococcus sp. Ld7]|uniref:MerR family DNA-binding protein n=1 Tax=Agrococcus sp. Ld7 TaxID=649148 RepID=UPI00386CD5F1
MTLRSGQVAERAGVGVRDYERRGLLAAPSRSLGGHRAYFEDTVALLRVIKSAQRLGFSLDEVAELLDAGRRRHPAPDLRSSALAKIEEIEQKIADLSTIRDSLRQVVDARCDSLAGCTCAQCPISYADLVVAEPTARSPIERFRQLGIQPR